MDTITIFSRNLRKILEEKEVSQRELAKRLDITPQAVNDWCQGKSMPRMRKIDQICRCLNVTRSDLLEDNSIQNELDKLTNGYKQLNNIGRDRLMEQLELLLLKDKYKKRYKREGNIIRIIR